MAENSFYYDGSLCIACRGCQVACKQWNGLPAEKTKFFAAPGGYQNPADLSTVTWNLVTFHEVAKDEVVEWFFRRRHCSHCTDAACIEVCPVEPVKAMTRHPETGTVYINQEICVGCGSCEDACPFGVPHVDDDLEKARKCTGCVDRVTEGMPPACVKTCPTEALRYGAKKEMYALAAKRVKELKKQGFEDANVFGVSQFGGLHSIYVLPAKLSVYGLHADMRQGALDPIKRKGKEKYAAWQREHDRKLASLTAGCPVGTTVLLGGLAAVGLKKLADRKERISRDEAEEQQET